MGTRAQATKPRLFVLDVDGVMTTGQFLYSAAGKEYKIFGAHDSDGLKMLRGHLDILFVTADKRGFGISKKRIEEDMGFDLKLVAEDDRDRFFEDLGYDTVVFMGDGIHDAPILKKCLCGIAPRSGRQEARSAAQYVTPSAAGDGAVLDACLYILERFYGAL